MKCPICGTENDYNWPLQVDGQIKTGGCQDCWEKQSDEEWWKTVVRIDKIWHVLCQPGPLGRLVGG